MGTMAAERTMFPQLLVLLTTGPAIVALVLTLSLISSHNKMNQEVILLHMCDTGLLFKQTF